jgi:hypothetical protein
MPRAGSTFRTVRETRAATAKRGVLAHIELVRSFGEALIRAADTYVTQHRISEAESDWRDDFPANLAEANKEFHRALAESMNRVSETFFGRSGETDEFEAARSGRRTSTGAETGTTASDTATPPAPPAGGGTVITP